MSKEIIFSLSYAKKIVKMIANVIVEGTIQHKGSVEFQFNDEVVRLYLNSKSDLLDSDLLTIYVYRDGVMSYTIHGINSLEGIKEMSSDLYFLLDAPYIDIKI